MQLELIAQFLSQYLTPNDGMAFPAKIEYIKDGIYMLLTNDIFTPGQLRLEAARDYGVIIPWDFFPKQYQPEGF